MGSKVYFESFMVSVKKNTSPVKKKLLNQTFLKNAYFQKK